MLAALDRFRFLGLMLSRGRALKDAVSGNSLQDTGRRCGGTPGKDLNAFCLVHRRGSAYERHYGQTHRSKLYRVPFSDRAGAFR